MGRAANNVCAFTTSGISLALVTSDNVALIMIGALVLLVAACAAFVAAGLFRLPQTEQEREREQLAEEALAAPTIEEQRQAFIANHALTPREVDVLIAVTQDERPLKQIAEELGISMRMVQRHLSSIYQKTDTQTRAGLTKAFPRPKTKTTTKVPVPFVVVSGRLAFELRHFVAVGRGDNVFAALAAQLGAVDDDVLAARHLPLAGAVALVERLTRLLLLLDQLGALLLLRPRFLRTISTRSSKGAVTNTAM